MTIPNPASINCVFHEPYACFSISFPFLPNKKANDPVMILQKSSAVSAFPALPRENLIPLQSCVFYHRTKICVNGIFILHLRFLHPKDLFLQKGHGSSADIFLPYKQGYKSVLLFSYPHDPCLLLCSHKSHPDIHGVHTAG